MSGDNASLALVASIAERARPVDVAVLFAGAARTALMDGVLPTSTLPARSRQLGCSTLPTWCPVYLDGWQHFHEGAMAVRAAFAATGDGHRLVLPKSGDFAELEARGGTRDRDP